MNSEPQRRRACAEQAARALFSLTVVWLVLLGCTLFPAVVRAQSVPLEQVEFTAYIAELLRTTGPEHIKVQVTVARPLAVTLSAPSGVAVEANLVPLHSHCVAMQGRCFEAAEKMLQAAFQVFAEATRPIERDMLRPVLRARAYVESLNELHRRRGMPSLIAKPYVGELWVVLAIKGTALIRMATSDTLQQLGLAEPAAFELALQNIRDTKAPVLERAQPLRGTRFNIIAEDGYEASRLLMHDEWSAVARSRAGDLIVSVPASDAVIFGAVRDREDIQALREIVASQARRTLVPISPQIFRWRPDGWELLDEPTARAQANPPVDTAAPAHPATGATGTR